MSLITPEDLPTWVPGTLLSDSATENWTEVRLRAYQFNPLDVYIPAMRDYLIVYFCEGSTVLNRRCAGRWQSEHVGPGFASLLTHARESDWNWADPVTVQHLYISTSKISDIASEVLEKDITYVELQDLVRTDDKVLLYLIKSLIDEQCSGALGGAIYVESLTNQIGIHLLRKYSSEFRERPQAPGGLTCAQAKRVREFIHENLDNSISLADMAQVVNLSVFHFVKQFQKKFGCAPYAYVMAQRLDRVKQLITDEPISLKVAAAQCGFSDQSHMTRVFRRVFKITPGEFRKQMRT
ncbi:MAG: helix-turn-helix transcriptional regulator [Proteobacteria bacterium]|nr:helix-turn-helix transcriptional regulator [Pseudomonadota bacterium]